MIKKSEEVKSYEKLCWILLVLNSFSAQSTNSLPLTVFLRTSFISNQFESFISVGPVPKLNLCLSYLMNIIKISVLNILPPSKRISSNA